MEITEPHREKLENIVSNMNCLGDFQCYRSGFTRLPNVKPVNAKGLLECFEKDRKNCEFALAFGDTYYCKCPVLGYAVENMGLKNFGL